MAMRKQESWLKKGARVCKSSFKNVIGVIVNVHYSKMDGETMVHNVNVLWDGFKKPTPYNPNELDKA